MKNSMFSVNEMKSYCFQKCNQLQMRFFFHKCMTIHTSPIVILFFKYFSIHEISDFGIDSSHVKY